MNPDLRPVIVSLVPRGWSADQAMHAVQLLQQVIAAIWCVHGEAMGKLVLGDASKRVDESAKQQPPKPTNR